VSCWGSNDKGQLGLGHDLCVGNLCAPDIVGLDLGDAAGKVEQVAAGVLHTCVRLATPVDNVMCWGYRAHGRLGYGDQDAEMAGIPSAAERGLVKLGARTAIDISVGEGFTCVVLDDHNARCWGQNNQGQLGQGDILSRGDSDETTPDRIPDIALGVAISKIRCGYEHVCALTSDQTVLCWGRNDEGQLGYGNTVNVGAVSPPIDAGAVDLGAAAIDLAVGKKHTCALLDTSEIKCWGAADDGQLGYGDEQIGDRATPASVGGVPFYPEP
jgi:alpha-tubulin suppressor-like RCC1 family protein